MWVQTHEKTKSKSLTTVYKPKFIGSNSINQSSLLMLKPFEVVNDFLRRTQ